MAKLISFQISGEEMTLEVQRVEYRVLSRDDLSLRDSFRLEKEGLRIGYLRELMKTSEPDAAVAAELDSIIDELVEILLSEVPQAVREQLKPMQKFNFIVAYFRAIKPAGEERPFAAPPAQDGAPS